MRKLNGDKDAPGGAVGHSRPTNLRQPPKRRNRQAGGSAVAATTGLGRSPLDDGDHREGSADGGELPAGEAFAVELTPEEGDHRDDVGHHAGEKGALRLDKPDEQQDGDAGAADAEEQQRAKGERELLRSAGGPRRRASRNGEMNSNGTTNAAPISRNRTVSGAVGRWRAST